MPPIPSDGSQPLDNPADPGSTEGQLLDDGSLAFDDTWHTREFGIAGRKKGWLERLAGLCATHPWTVIIIWLLIATGSGLYSLRLPDYLTTEMKFYGDKDSYYANQLIEEYKVGAGELTSEMILIHSLDPKVTVGTERFTKEIRKIEHDVTKALNDVEGNRVHKLTLDTLEDGKIPRPSVLGRQTILDLVDKEKDRVTKHYEREGDKLEARGEELKARGEDLQTKGANVEAALANAYGILGQQYRITPDQLPGYMAKLEEAKAQAPTPSTPTPTIVKPLAPELTMEQIKEKADKGDPQASVTYRKHLYHELEAKVAALEARTDDEAKEELVLVKRQAQEALVAWQNAKDILFAINSGNAVMTPTPEQDQEAAQAPTPTQAQLEQSQQHQLMLSVFGKRANDPAFLELLASLEDLKKQGDILKLQGDTLKQDKDQLEAEADDLKVRADKEKADGEAQEKDLDAFINRLVAKDKLSTIVIASFDRDETHMPVHEWNEAISKLSDDTFRVTSIGVSTINKAFQEDLGNDLINAELIGVPIALLVMVYVFRSLAGPLVPLFLGVIAILTARGAITVISQVSTQQIFIENVVSMLGLAIGIDYALFIVQRFNENRILGHGRVRAIERALATSGKAVVFSGFTVAVSLSGVTLVPANIFSSLGMGAVVIVACALLAVITLLPAVLAVYGGIINWPFGKRASMEEPITKDNIFDGFWGKTTKLSVTHPWMTMISSVVILLVLAYPIFGMHMGFSSTLDIEKGDISKEWNYMQEEYAPGMLAPYSFIIKGNNAKAAAEDLVAHLEDDDYIDSLQMTEYADHNRVAYIEAIGAKRQASLENYEHIGEWRSGMVKDLQAKHNVTIHIGGVAAAESDMLELLGPTTPWVFALVLSLSFILLMLAFRSIVVPIKAMIYNVLSVGATYGILMLVFKHGYLIDWLGYHHRPLIEAWLPIMLFCILFGLSMDYHVFILSRIREHYDITHDNKESVTVGLRATSRLITGAAAIMVVIFIAFSFSSSIQLQQFGFGLAVAVLLDATIIRVFLVPSLMVLMREANWWLPRWLHWLPDLRIEGDPEDSAISSSNGQPIKHVYERAEVHAAIDEVEAIKEDSQLAKFLGLESATNAPPPPQSIPKPKPQPRKPTEQLTSWEDIFSAGLPSDEPTETEGEAPKAP